MNEEWKKKTFDFSTSFRLTLLRTETPNKKKKMNEQVFVTTSDTKTIKAVSVDLETFAVSDVLSSLMGDDDDRRNLEGINLRSTRTGQMFPNVFSNKNNHHLQSSFTPSLRQLGVQNNDHFILQVSLLGGGGDGGATGAESRSAYLEMYNDNPYAKKKETLGGFVSFSSQSTVRDFDKKEDELSRYFNCSLTEEMLDSTIEDGIFVDLIGNLYNKEAVLKCLQRKAVEKTPLPMRIEHVTGLKALVTCKFHKKEEEAKEKMNKKNKDDVHKKNNSFRPTIEKGVFSCPLTGLDFNGKTKFVVLRPSGVVVSEKAIREAKESCEEMNDGVSLKDAPPFIPINPTGDVLEAMKEQLEKENLMKKEKKEKKNAKKKKNNKADNVGDNDVEEDSTNNNNKRKNGCDDVSAEQAKKSFKATDPKHMPQGATASVYSSLFTSSTKPEDQRKETFLARSTRF
jgi:hypothetical protein|tara:strand:+ start:2509 stop:3873 length:1365 start_codon:yes stop_codon:yes gene_type:complete